SMSAYSATPTPRRSRNIGWTLPPFSCETKRGPMRHVSFLAFSLAAFAALVTRPAHAGSFDPSGNFAFDPSAIVTNGFDDLVSPPDGVKLVRAPGGVQGAGYLTVNTQNNAASFTVALPHTDASYIARVFARTNRINATISISYAD